MKKVWFSFFALILFFSAMDIFGGNSETTTLIFLAVHVIFSCLILHTMFNHNRLIWVGAFLARIGFMVWDLNAQHIFTFPNSGADSDMYFHQALAVSQDISLLVADLRGGIYSKINGLLFYLIGPQRIVGHYLNVLLGLSVVAVVYRILQRLDVHPRMIKFVLLAAAFFPNSLIMSGIFLREIFATLLVAVSLYYFICWFQKNNFKDMFLAVAMLGIASVFHSGVIGLLLGYAFAFLFYRSNRGRLEFSMQSILVFVVLATGLTLSVTRYQDVFFSKFQNVEQIEDIYATANSRLGASAYLKGFTIDSPSDLVVVAPLKIIYFMAAPVMFDWRGVMDVVTFFLDSLLYIGTFCYFLFNRRAFSNRKTLYICLMLTLAGAIVIFGIGVSNAGTAVRHRQKLIPLFLVLLAITMDARRRLKEAALLRRRQSRAVSPLQNPSPTENSAHLSLGSDTD